MSKQQPYYDDLPPQTTIPDPSQSPISVETVLTRPTRLETAIIQATPEARLTPSWFNETVTKISDAWFDPKSFESPELYEGFGIREVKKKLPTSGDLIRRLVWKRFGDRAWVKHGMVDPSVVSII